MLVWQGRGVGVGSLGNVSVVVTAWAASSQPRPCAACAGPAITAENFLASSGSPMTPVDARKTSPGLHCRALAVMSAVSLVARRPFLPVNALALPELTTSARARPGLIRARHHSTGADGHLERVNTPATVVPGSNPATLPSVPPPYRTPPPPAPPPTP